MSENDTKTCFVGVLVGWHFSGGDPTAMMKTKWRGLPTECVGVITPGIPISCNIFNENKDSNMENDTTEANLKPFSLAIIGLVVKSREQCLAGYGVGVKSIKHVDGVNVTMSGLYHEKLFYTDRRAIGEQTDDRLAVKTSVKVSFINKLVRYSTKNQTTEKPIVSVKLSVANGDGHKAHGHRVHMQSNNAVLELEMVDSSSIYDGKRFRITIPENMFTITETGLDWIQFYFQWLLDTNACTILFVHDDYQFNRMAEGTASASMHCTIIPDEAALFTARKKRIIEKKQLPSRLTPSQLFKQWGRS